MEVLQGMQHKQLAICFWLTAVLYLRSVVASALISTDLPLRHPDFHILAYPTGSQFISLQLQFLSFKHYFCSI